MIVVPLWHPTELAMAPAVYLVRVTSSVFQVLGFALTTWRIYIRLSIHRFWWEDALAAALLFVGLLWIVAEWINMETNGLESIVADWIHNMCFTTIIMLVRMSVLFSIIRIIPGKSRLLNFSYACVAYYVACWLTLIVMKAVQCVSDQSWHHHAFLSGGPLCRVKPPIAVVQFTTDCVAISVIVALPLRILWRVKLPRYQRRMILCIFSSSVVLAFGTLFHTIAQILNISIAIVAGVNVEVAFSLIVCNLLVVVTFTYRFWLRSRDGTDGTNHDLDDDFTTPFPRATSLQLTTVDLDDPITQTTEGSFTRCSPTPGLFLP